jgi:pimeloyl-ACP methyl ester carboxylesterase
MDTTTDPTPGVTTVLLHGAGMSPWIWERVTAHLRGPSFAPEYPGRTPAATPDRCADAIIAQLDRANIRDVHLVLHSLAGVLAAPLARRLGERLKRLVLVAAIVPAPGRTFAQTMGFPARLMLPLLFRFNPHGLKPSEGMIRRELCGDLTPTDADKVVVRYEAEWPGLYITPTTVLPPGIPMAAVLLTRDRSIPPSLQRALARRLGITHQQTLNAGHLPMLSQPRELASLLDVAFSSAR